MHPYKVKYVELEFSQDWKKMKSYGRADIVLCANELEALLIEENEVGYEWISTTPISELIPGSSGPKTTCLMATFKKKSQ